MKRRGLLSLCLVMTVCGGCCISRMSNSELATMRPSRPEALDRLDMLAGDWETSGEIRTIVAKDVIHTHGHNHAEWDVDRRLLLDHSKMDMGPMGAMSGLSVWSYDESAKKYRMWWFDSFGETSVAVVRYDDRTDTWRMMTAGRKYGFSTSGWGTIHRVDADTLEWTWVERGFGFFTLARMKGTSHRTLHYDGLD